ncbi:MAG: cytidine deaminase [Anaerolineae bacterium]|nr:cytidine deaminase [Anaerolineae bacterium]
MNIDALIEQAKQAREGAYAPYSHFAVGAALLTRSGRVFTGANVENASYGLTVCAERVAVFKAVTAGEREFAAIAIASSNGASPCGACRQVLAEFGLDILVISVDMDDRVRQWRLEELLPASFGPQDLPR